MIEMPTAIVEAVLLSILPPPLSPTPPGAATADIIAQYVSTIKALAACDPSGAILGAVSVPIRAYLRGRRDTIRCIVTSLTADEEDAAAQSLLAELDNTEAAAEVGGAGKGKAASAAWLEVLSRYLTCGATGVGCGCQGAIKQPIVWCQLLCSTLLVPVAPPAGLRQRL